jgi:outer membrane protein assembly factor BamB
MDREAQRIGAAPDALATTLRRVERRRTLRRVATIGVALAVAVIAIGSALSIFRASVDERPMGHGLTPNDVRHLSLGWHASLTGHVSTPIQIGDSAYVWSHATGRLIRMPVECASDGSTCAQSVSMRVGNYVGPTGMRFVDGVLYVASSDGRLAAYRCQTVCDTHALWFADVPGRPSQPTVGDGVVYTVALSHRAGRSTLYAFDVGCSSDGGTCIPSWTGRGPSGSSFAPVVDHGFVFVGHAMGPLYAFHVGCGAGGESCEPAWVGVPGLDLSFTTWPVTVGNVAVILTDRGLLALDPVCFSESACEPVWRTSRVDGISLASDGARLYVATIHGDVLGFDADCGSDGATCAPSWTAHLPGDAPASFGSLIVRDGVVYVGTSTGKAFAFDVACRSDCPPLWSATIGGGHVGIVAEGDTVLATARGTVEAFRPRS